MYFSTITHPTTVIYLWPVTDITKENFEYLAGAGYLDSNTLIVNVGNEYEELGSGLFVMQTLLNHSCDDNVEIIAAGTLRAKIEVEANRDIPNLVSKSLLSLLLFLFTSLN